MAERERESAPVTVWRRWRSEGVVRFHRYCDLVPFEVETFDPRKRRVRVRFAREASERSPPEMRYTSGAARTTLRFTPLVIFAAVVFYVVRAELAPQVVGLGVYLGDAGLAGGTPLLAATALWLLALAWLLWDADVLPGREFLVGLFVYGLLFVLVAGVLFAVYLVATAPAWGVGTALTGAGKTDHVAFVSGFLLMLFLGGYLVYDGMLKTENMFSELHRKRDSIIEDEEPGAYEAFLDDFEASLEAAIDLPGGVSVRTEYAFAVLFVAPFFLSSVLFWFGDAGILSPSAGAVRTLVAALAAVIPALLDVVLVVVFFQFLILVRYFNRLLTEHGPETAGDGSFTIRYRPYHPDEYAGFKDFGRFATRVNMLLVIGGLYVVQRIYVGGARTFPVDAAGAMTSAMVNWLVSMIGPLVFYVLAVVVWMYFSFWQVHRTMRRGKQIELGRLPSDDEAAERKRYELRREGPVWPVNSRFFLSMLSLDLLPLIGAVPAVGF